MMRRMWPGGPLRQFTEGKHPSSWTPYQSSQLRGFAGQYVCDECLEPTAGVYRVISPSSSGKRPSWMCSGCRDKARVRKPQPEALVRYRNEAREAM
jgi:hypothetical protein